MGDIKSYTSTSILLHYLEHRIIILLLHFTDACTTLNIEHATEKQDIATILKHYKFSGQMCCLKGARYSGTYLICFPADWPMVYG